MIPFAFIRSQYVEYSTTTFVAEVQYNIVSPNYYVMMQLDGNFVMTGPSGPIWDTNTYGHSCSPSCVAKFQSDGNFVVKQGSTVLFTTGLTGATGAKMRFSVTSPYMQIILNNTVLWSSGP